jgi:phthalate 4,5-cis-dihydrodiol dehydrogenase
MNGTKFTKYRTERRGRQELSPGTIEEERNLMADESVVRVGIIGLGIAARQVLGSIQQTRGAALTAVCDVRKDELERFKSFGVEIFTDPKEMCQNGPVDAVWVATPNHLHAPHTILAADSGKHVICEKPMAIHIEEANAMVEAIERNKVIYVQGHSRIHRPYTRKMGEIIASGRLGRVIHINTWMYNDWIQRPWSPHSLDPKLGGGVVFRQGPHQVDVVRYLAGGIVRSVRGRTGKWQRYYDVEGDYHAFFDFEDGPTAMISFNGYGNFDIRELTWNIGEGGTIRSNEIVLGARPRGKGAIGDDEFYNLPQYSIEALNQQRPDRKQDFFGLIVVSCENGDIRQSPDGLYVYTEKGREEVLMSDQELKAGEVQELVDCVRQNRQSFIDARWGRATLEACIGMIESSRERREVLLKYQVPSPLKCL